MRVFKVRAEYLYGEDKEEKRAKQLEALQASGATEDSEKTVYCDASVALDLLIAGYCGTSYINMEAVAEVKFAQGGANVEDIRRSAQPEGYSEAFNHRCRTEQPTPWLHEPDYVLGRNDPELPTEANRPFRS